jgi:hypothetical protein
MRGERPKDEQFALGSLMSKRAALATGRSSFSRSLRLHVYRASN